MLFCRKAPAIRRQPPIPSPAQSPSQRVPELDGLRGVAIALVVMRHYVHHPGLLLLGPQWGWMGVNLFFVLSGFLITSILLRLTGRPGVMRTFYARRTLRIFPLYFLALAVYFSASGWVGSPQPLKTVLLYATFLQAFLPPLVSHLRVLPHPAWVMAGFAVLWSLSVEEYFYLLWAPVVAAARANRRILLFVLLPVLLLTPWIRFFYPDPKAGQELFLAQMDSLAAGCLVAVLWRDHAAAIRPAFLRRLPRVYAAIAALVALAIGIDFATGITKRSVFDLRIFNATDYTVLWMAWSLWLLATLAEQGTDRPVARLLRNRALRRLGRISYCLYVVHYPIYMALRGYVSHGLALIVALAVSLGVSQLSWRYFEGPIARWKQQAFRYRMAAEPEAPAANGQ